MCQRRLLQKAATAQGLPPPGLRELAGVGVSAACSEKQRLLRVSHHQGSGSWRVCVSAPRAPKSSGYSGFHTGRALGASGCVCRRRLLEEAAPGYRVPHSQGSVSWGVCVSATCSEKQRLLRVCHRQGSGSWRVCVSAPRARRSSGCSRFASARALGAGGCVCVSAAWFMWGLVWCVWSVWSVWSVACSDEYWLSGCHTARAQ